MSSQDFGIRASVLFLRGSAAAVVSRFCDHVFHGELVAFRLQCPEYLLQQDVLLSFRDGSLRKSLRVYLRISYRV